MRHWLSGGDSVLKQASALITPILFFAPMTRHWAVDSRGDSVLEQASTMITPTSFFARLICITEQ